MLDKANEPVEQRVVDFAVEDLTTSLSILARAPEGAHFVEAQLQSPKALHALARIARVRMLLHPATKVTNIQPH